MPKHFTDDEQRRRIMLGKKALEITCYVLGAGAFSVFVRWLQLMLGFTDGLADSTIFNILVPLMMVIAGFVFLRFVDKFRNERWYVPEDFYDAFYNPGKVYSAVRWGIGVLMAGGGLFLLISSETDKNADFLRVLSLLGVLTGLTFPLVLTSANKPHASSRKAVCYVAVIPIIFFCWWLVTVYKVNANNPVTWEYGPEAVAVILSIIAFFRVAGFPFGTASPWRSMFFGMLASAADIMVLADTRYIGMQAMFLAAALMLTLYNWVLITNLLQRPKPVREQPNDGFERL